MRRRSLFLLAILVLVAAPLWAKDAPAAKTPTMKDAKSVVQRNMRLRLQGQDAGGMAMRLGRMEDGGKLLETEYLMRVKRGNGPDADLFESRSLSLEYYDASGRKRWGRSREVEGGAVTTTSSKLTNTHAEVTFDAPGTSFEKTIERPENHATDFEVFRRLLAKFKRGEKAHEAYVTLDTEEVLFKRHEMTILEATEFERAGEKHAGYRVKAVAPMGVAMIVCDEEYLPMHMSMMGGVIEAVWIDESPFEFAAEGWSMSSFVPVEGTAPMSKHLESLELTVTFATKVPGEDGKPLFRDTRYQTVKKDGDAYRLTLHSTRPKVEAVRRELPVAVEDEAIRRYLDATPLSQSDHPAIVEQAKAIVGDTKDAYMAAARIVYWVYRTLEKKSGARGSASAVEVLECRSGDCTEHAALTVALCRAAGIPARNVGGLEYLVLRDGGPAAGYHAWAEVWLGSWIGVDATIPEVGTAARYVLLDIDEPGEEESAPEVMRLMFGKLRLRIDAYKHVGGKHTVLAR